MPNNQFSALDNVKMTFQNTYILKFPSTLLLGKDVFSLTIVDLEYETSVSICEFEMMVEIK